MALPIVPRFSQPVKIPLSSSFVPPEVFNKERPLYVKLPDDAYIGVPSPIKLDKLRIDVDFKKLSASTGTRTPSSDDETTVYTSNGDDDLTPTSSGDGDSTPRFADKQLYPTPGSSGHPELCSRPCLYFASGSCSNGADCTFCHLPHDNRRARLDKSNRVLFRNMGLIERASAVFYVLRERLYSLGFDLKKLAPLEQLIAKEFPELLAAAQERSHEPSYSKRLMGALASFDTGRLIRLLKHETWPPAAQPAIDEAADNLFRSLSDRVW